MLGDNQNNQQGGYNGNNSGGYQQQGYQNNGYNNAPRQGGFNQQAQQRPQNQGYASQGGYNQAPQQPNIPSQAQLNQELSNIQQGKTEPEIVEKYEAKDDSIPF